MKELETVKGSSQADREKYARLEERLNIIGDAFTPKQQAKQDEDPEPNAEDDIFAYNAWLKRNFDRLSENFTRLEQAQEQERETQRVQQSYERDALTFARTEPAFADAYKFLMASRVQELALYFYGKDLSEEGATLQADELSRIAGVISGEERDLVSGAMKGNRSPAKSLYALARARGFVPKAPAPEVKPNGKGNGAAKADAAPGSLAKAAADVGDDTSVGKEIERIKAGVAGSTSLSQGGGAPQQVALSAQKLADMPQDEFNAMMDQLRPEEIARMLGK